ncbi:NACHT domain-containing protein [Amylibacter sp. SFDW26]|uniref:NACHT domain-containing protein n=1 Tax=Amylibacter sp. SFDW26 TaxID=2652722 RepID=UPI001261D42B|nr:NACHT domain-containing protein [Amylibacter sp. SFDW26]KAB7613625.1 NACHT domain-containing protein [Amylibacter sp. SFDW26]
MSDLPNNSFPIKSCLVRGAPKNFKEMSLDATFTHLLESGSWSYNGLANFVNDVLEDKAFLKANDLDPKKIKTLEADNVKTWGLKSTKISTAYRLGFYEVLRRSGDFHDTFSDSWIEAFSYHWAEIRVNSRARNKSTKDRFLSKLQKRVLANPNITHLPSLFETDQPLPLATAYVDLAISASPKWTPALSRLQPAISLAEKISLRQERRFAERRSPQDLFDRPGLQTSLILGDPGAGKSSLLKKIALEIAEGRWKYSSVPLFVEAREFWRHAENAPSLSLEEFALQTVGETELASREKHEQFLFPQDIPRPSVILLIDGLDEIANSPDAVRHVYNSLKNLSKKLPWIATCRPTGLAASLSENLRCDIVDLDEEAIEILVKNWCAEMSTETQTVASDALLQEISGSSSLREMATNPFLLTALCFLKSVAPDQQLPATRIEVYEELLERIGQQARDFHQDPKILTEEDMGALSEFCLHLYEKEDSLQIFTQKNWQRYLENNPSVSTDLRTSILPARLLTSWNVGTKRYHFLHLSLQEFLIAKAALERGIEFIFSKRFTPVWRPVFRFFGALLLAQGRQDDFKSLVNRLFEESDLSGYTFLTVAEIFSDAGIKDTRDWIGEDLRERLYFAATSGEEMANEALTDALSVLDPYFLEHKAHVTLDFRLRMKAETNYVDEHAVISMTLDSPYQVLARARTPKACELIRDAFFGKDESEAVLAAHAFALTATYEDRKRAITKINRSKKLETFAPAFIAFSDATRRLELLPALAKIAKYYADLESGEFQTTLGIISRIGGLKAAEILEDILLKLLKKSPVDQDGLFNILQNIAGVGGVEATEILKLAAQQTSLLDRAEEIKVMSLEADPNNFKLVEDAIKKPELRDRVIDALSGAANSGRPVDEEICKLVAREIRSGKDSDIMDIALLEGARLDAGLEPLLCGDILEGAIYIYDLSKGDDFERQKDLLISNFATALDTLGRAPWKPAAEMIEKILFDKRANEHFLGAAIMLSGQVFENTKNHTMINQLIKLWYDNPGGFEYHIIEAIGRIDFHRLFRLQSGHYANYAIEQIAAERDWLIFQDFYALPDGSIHEWVCPPDGLLFLFSEDEPEIAAELAHKLARHDFAMFSESHPRCCAVLLFPEQNDWSRQELEVFKSDPRRTGPILIYEVPEDLSEDDLEEYAKRLAAQIRNDMKG